jgi:ABC-type transport system involved in multi-copper enzyme maturation permease subunit
MLNQIIKKEVQNNLYSFRFSVTFALLIVIVTFTVFILTQDYAKKIDEYSQRQAEIENYMKRYAHFNRVLAIISLSQPPLPIYSLIRGLTSETGLENFNNDPLPVMFPLLDLIFIVTILLSLVALIFAYNSVCGEKEEGTLKLMLSNSISRSSIILGKIAGGMITILIPFIISLILGLLVILLNQRISWKGEDWKALGMIFLGSILYIAFFYCLGAFVSSRHHSGSSSIMTSLFLWVMAVLVIPNLSPYIASFLSPAPSRIKIGREVYRITQVERDEVGRKMYKEAMKELIKKYPVLAENLSEAEAREKAAQNPAYREAYQAQREAIEKAWREANIIQSQKTDAIQRELARKEEAQTRLSSYLSMISPLADFTYLATDLSSTGMKNILHFQQLSRTYGNIFAEYRQKKMTLLQKQDPTVDWWNTPVDMSDRPRFNYVEEALSVRIRSSLPYFTVLIIYVLLFFLTSYFSFAKYDIR